MIAEMHRNVRLCLARISLKNSVLRPSEPGLLPEASSSSASLHSCFVMLDSKVFKSISLSLHLDLKLQKFSEVELDVSLYTFE